MLCLSIMDTSPEFWSRHWKGRFGWDDRNALPRLTSPAWIRRVPIPEGRDVKKFSIEASDGKPESLWPLLEPGYLEQGKALDLTVENEPFNYLWIQGSSQGSNLSDQGRAEDPAAGPVSANKRHFGSSARISHNNSASPCGERRRCAR